MNWDEANHYCQELSLPDYPSGWRLPTLYELTDVSFSRLEKNAPHVGGWSSTLTDGNGDGTPDTAYLSSGTATSLGYQIASAACVQARPSPLPDGAERFIPKEDIIWDSMTGLNWQANSTVRRMNWDGANGYCQALELASGYPAPWRLPSMRELYHVVSADSANAPNLTFVWSSDCRYGRCAVFNRDNGGIDAPLETPELEIAYVVCVQ